MNLNDQYKQALGEYMQYKGMWIGEKLNKPKLTDKKRAELRKKRKKKKQR